MWKIIGTDNFDRETVSDILVAEHFTLKKLADTACKALNDEWCSGDHSPTFFKVVDQDHKLYVFES